MTDSEWQTVRGYSRYLASPGRPGVSGEVRNRAGQVLSVGLSNRGRPTVTLTRDDGKRGPVELGVAILLAHVGERPPGKQCCHLDDDPFHNWLGDPGKPKQGGVVWGTPAENEAHKAANGNAVTPKPSYPCRNAPACDGLALHEGRRCSRCVHQAGLDIAARVNRRENLQALADEYGFGADWAWRLASPHGVTVTKREALTQHPPRLRRVTNRLRSLRVTGARSAGGDAA